MKVKKKRMFPFFFDHQPREWSIKNWNEVLMNKKVIEIGLRSTISGTAGTSFAGARFVLKKKGSHYSAVGGFPVEMLRILGIHRTDAGDHVL